MPAPGEGRGDRAALDALRRGRPHPASLHARSAAGWARSPRACGARKQPLRRAAGAVLPRSRWCCTRAAATCATVTGAETVAAHAAAARATPGALDSAARACDAVARLFDSTEPHPERLQPAGQRARAARRASRPAPTLANQLAFRLKLLLAAGLRAAARRVRLVRRARAPRRLLRAPPAASCAGRARRASFPLDEEAHAFLVDALGRPLAETPPASERALRQAERAIAETVEHHAHLRLRAAAAG